jgi:hypothetical protein
MMIGSSVMQFFAGCITSVKAILGTANTRNYHNVISTYPNHAQHVGGRSLMRLQNSSLKEWKYTQTNGQVRYLLAPDLEHAAWAAAELSGGTKFVKDVRLCDEW